ncbi:unnamed protein product [Brachionus calyciflorus]|uniref:Apple domain-containing protein n=1 Tax=Brachionus calyciflorus TaxID=104777 RepID=A0A813YTD1_9BILA|nr:unnamed protein product [Brachionus calyciflorus]
MNFQKFFVLTLTIFLFLKCGGVRLLEWNYDSTNQLYWSLDCDFESNDLTNSKMSAELCGPTCSRTNGCTHFTWSDYQGGTCWMKKGSISKNNAKINKGLVCGIVDNNDPDNGGQTQNNVLATRHGATEMGACELPQGDYAVNLPVALGNIDSLGYLKFNGKYCGQILRINCGNGDLDIIVTNSNLGGGLDLYGSTWDLATNRKPPGETNCSVKLTNRNMLKSSDYQCYHSTGETNNSYYRNVGLFNTNGKLVVGAKFKGADGAHRGNNGYWAFDGYGTGDDQVNFYFQDGSNHAVFLRDCKNGSNKQIWS